MNLAIRLLLFVGLAAFLQAEELREDLRVERIDPATQRRQSLLHIESNAEGKIVAGAVCADERQRALEILVGIPSVTNMRVLVGEKFVLGKEQIGLLGKLPKLSILRITGEDSVLAKTNWPSFKEVSTTLQVIEVSSTTSDFPERAVESLVKSAVTLGSREVVFRGIYPASKDRAALEDQQKAMLARLQTLPAWQNYLISAETTPGESLTEAKIIVRFRRE